MAMRSGPIERNCKTAKGKDILYDMYQMMKTVVILRALFCFVLFCFVLFCFVFFRGGGKECCDGDSYSAAGFTLILRQDS